MKSYRRLPLVFISVSFLFACGNKNQESKDQPEPAPSSSSFMRMSDPAAVQLIDSLIHASGGTDAWNDIHFISWNVSGERDISWDKKNGKVKIVSPANKTSFLLDLKQGEGTLKQDGQLKSDHGMIEAAFNQWKADSTDLFFPFNLKHPNYQVVYLGDQEVGNGKSANVVELRHVLDTVNVQPKYRILIDQKDNLIIQIIPHDPAAPESLGAPITFDNYKKYGPLLLSANRSSGKGPRDVKIESSVPEKIFDEF